MKTPFAFQRSTVRWLKSRDVAIIGHEMGLGKTFCATMAMDVPAIIACPAFLIYNWYDEAIEYGYTATIVREQADLFKDVDVFIMSFHFLVNLDLAVVDAAQFIVDEFHYGKSLDAKRTQAMLVEIECTPRVFVLSGTPIPSRPVEIYPILDAFGIFDRGYYSFVHTYCDAKTTRYGLDVNGASNLEQLADLIAPHMIRYTKKQVLPELPEKIYRVVSLDIALPPEELEYKVDQFKHVNPDVAFDTLSTVMRIHATVKYPHVCEIVDHYLQVEDKLIVFGHHREEMLLPLIERYGDFNPAQIIGGMSAIKKKEQEYKFQNDPTCRIIVIGILAGGVGLTLTAASRVILAESSWVPGNIDQAADRAHRIGQLSTVNVDLITIRGSIDEYQLRRALEKLEIINQLIKETPLMSDNIRESLEAIKADIEGLIESLPEEESGEEETKPTRRRRGKKADDAEAEEKPKRTRRSRKAVKEDEDEDESEEDESEEDEDEEEEAPKKRTRRARGKKADDDEAEEKPKRRRRGKAAAEEEDEEEEEEKPAPKKRATRKKAAAKEESPFDKVRRLSSEMMKATSRADLVDLLGDFEVKKVSELEEGDYDEFCVEAQAAIDDA